MEGIIFNPIFISYFYNGKNRYDTYGLWEQDYY